MSAPTLPPSRFEAGAASHRGCVREENEDAFLSRPDLGLWVVADGMGGHAGGRYASTLLVDVLGRIPPPRSAADLLGDCEDCLIQVNWRLNGLGEAQGSTIGTTVAALLAFEGHYACIWSGDSRIYRLRQGELLQVSKDHTEVQDLIDAGVMTAEEARRSPRRNVVTRAIGAAAAPELDMTQGLLAPGDCFLLCSDGLTGHVLEPEIRAALLTGSAQAACDGLVALTLDRGAADNVTVVVMRYQ